MPRSRATFVVPAVVFVGSFLIGAHAQSPSIGPELYRQLRFRYIGPVGNRLERGDLRLVQNGPEGAEFALTLPIAASVL